MFRRPTVDGIISDITGLISKLRAEAVRQDFAATEASVRIAELAEEREAAIAECGRADRIADKLEELVS